MPSPSLARPDATGPWEIPGTERYDQWFTARSRERKRLWAHIRSSRQNRLTSTGPMSGWTSFGPMPRTSWRPFSTRDAAGTHQFREERDVIVRTSLARIDQLDIGEQALCFGRIDRRADDDSVESFHIGRLGISGDDVDPLVVDWRAPVPSPSTGPPAASPWTSSCAATWPPTDAASSASRTSTSAANPLRRRRPVVSRRSGGRRCRPNTRARSTTRPSSSGAPAPSWPLSKGPAPATCATSSPPSSGSRTRSSGRRYPVSSSSRVVPAPARRPWPCTGPPTSSTPTVSPSSARASS